MKKIIGSSKPAEAVKGTLEASLEIPKEYGEGFGVGDAIVITQTFRDQSSRTKRWRIEEIRANPLDSSRVIFDLIKPEDEPKHTIESMRSERKFLRYALQRVEFLQTDGWKYWCAVCSSSSEENHTADCIVGRAIAMSCDWPDKDSYPEITKFERFQWMRSASLFISGLAIGISIATMFR